MKPLRAILAGVLVWTAIFLTFPLLGYAPMLQDSPDLMALVVGALVVPYAVFGAGVYYKSGSRENGIKIGLVMAFTALILDASVTVPFIEIPKGGNYWSFFTAPMLWMFVLITMTTVYLFWQWKVAQKR